MLWIENWSHLYLFLGKASVHASVTIQTLKYGMILVGVSFSVVNNWILLFCRANAQQPKLFVGMILILIFAEALALYGLIVGIILSSRAGQSRAD